VDNCPGLTNQDRVLSTILPGFTVLQRRVLDTLIINCFYLKGPGELVLICEIMRRILSARLLALCAVTLLIYTILKYAASSQSGQMSTMTSNGIDIGWYPPSASWITDIDQVVNGEGTFDFRYGGHDPFISGQYSYCDMERVRPGSYIIPPKNEYELIYVEVVSMSSQNGL
jgi:hypothetical protein